MFYYFGINMKKLIVILLSVMFLTACTEEKQHYEQAVLKQMQVDPDIKDYNLDPQVMTECVVDMTSRKMPGIVSFDPRRGPYYLGYSKLISVTKAADPQEELKQIREFFGSSEEIRKALNNYSDSVMQCITALVSKSEEELEPGNS